MITNEVGQVLQNHYWGAGSEWFWAFLQFVVVAATLALIAWQVSYIARQVKLQTIQTQIETMAHVVQSVSLFQDRWNSEAMQRVRLVVCNRWEGGQKEFKEFDGACDYIADFFEELGTYLKIKAIPKETMWDVQSWNIEHYWFMFENGIEKLRKEMEEPVFCEFEQMFRVMREISDAKQLPCVDETSLASFIKREIRATKACLDLRR